MRQVIAEIVDEMLADELQPFPLQERIKDKYPAFRATAVSGETGGDEEREAAIAVLVETERRVFSSCGWSAVSSL